MQNSTYTQGSATEEELLMQQLTAVLCPPAAESVSSVPLVADIGNILLQLSEAVAQAKNEAERERTMRVALEAENEAMKVKQLMLSESVSTLGDEAGVYGYESVAPLTTPSFGSLIDSSLSLSDCLGVVTCMPQELVYISYYNAGFSDLDLSTVERVYKPYDFGNLMFVVVNAFEAVVPAGLLPFSLDGLQSLLAGSMHVPTVVSTTSPVSSAEDDAPRMNLLEALNVQSDEDCQRIVTVRKCHKLGFKSHIALKQYFSRFGKVERVVLLPMRAKPKNAMDGRGNRPSSMGFVVMETKEGADRILSFNNSCGIHEIKGWPIEVRNFVKPADKPDRDISGSTAVTCDLLSAW